jgi:hypothetical protein
MPRHAHLALTLAHPNKVTPTRVILSFSSHYVKYSRKRLAVALSGAFCCYPLILSDTIQSHPGGRAVELSAQSI